MGELEVGRTDLHPIAPARFRPDVVRQPERLRRDVHCGDEVRPDDEVWAGLERALENLGNRRVEAQPAARQGIEAGRLRLDRPQYDERAAAFRRLRGSAARSRDREERDGDRRGEGYSASHQFSAFPCSVLTPF